MPYLKTEAYHDPSEKPRDPSKKITISVLLVVLILGGGLFVWRARVQGAFPRFGAGRGGNNADSSAVIARISKHVALPTGETPLVGTVTNAAALRSDQDFFAAVENGDVVVLYQKYQRAILYRPSRDILVNMGPIVLPPPVTDRGNAAVATAKPSVPPAQQPSPSVVAGPLKLDIRNGSKTGGIAAQLGKSLGAQANLYQVISVAPAARTTYRGTTLVILPGVDSARVEELKKKLGNPAIVNELPAGENKTTADCVIILGNS